MSGEDHSGNRVANGEGDAAYQAETEEGPENVQVIIPPKRPSLMLFERSNGSIIKPCYDSSELENYFLECAFPEACHRIRFCLIYMTICSIVWIIYAAAVMVRDVFSYVGIFLVILVVSLVIFGITFTRWFERFYGIITGVWAVIMILLTLCMFAISPAGLSYIVMMGLCLQLLLIIYTVIPVPLLVCVILGLLLSIPFEILLCVSYGFDYLLAVRIIVQIAMHLMGMHLHIMSQVRRRSTFIQLCHSARSKKEIKVEQRTNNEMIRSLMPDKVAVEVMAGESKKKGERHRRDSDQQGSDFDSEHGDDQSDKDSDSEEPDDEERQQNDEQGKSVVTFRKFHVSQMEHVSILYADIVGFTKMSSNKTAPHLVFLLNDLFGRFDKLCELNGNEKIATLGDCYYCVAGCPNPVDNHAERCVEMGRSMCLAIQQFDEDHKEEVNMRVGVHTGMVICGIVGTRRFKFDVWSNDVSLANEMESSGQAGKVHISESTLGYVDQLYDVEEGEPVPDIRKIKVLTEYFDEKQKCYAIKHVQDEADIKTYFILNRKDGKQPISLRDGTNAESGVIITEEDPAIKGDEKTGLKEEGEAAAGDKADDSATPEDRRDSSDSALVENMRAEKDVFYFPPVSPLSLNFTNASMERKYRRLGLKAPRTAPLITTLATPRVTQFIDTLVFAIMLLLTTAACFTLPGYWAAQVPVLFVALLVALLVLVPLAVDRHCTPGPGFFAFYERFFSWNWRNIVGALLLFLLAATVLAALKMCSLRAEVAYTFGFAVLLLFSVTTFVLFTMYSFWTKLAVSVITFLIGAVLFVIAPLSTCGLGRASSLTCANLGLGRESNATETNDTSGLPAGCQLSAIMPVFANPWPYVGWEFIVSIVLMLLLVSFLNRKFEISYRLSFNCYQAAQREKAEINTAKKRSIWLLENIIPHYIISDLKNTKKYSQHMKDVGVVFATLSNFSQFYDEQFQGGREMLRVLNEIFADFEHLLTKSKYKDVEKIKTIGACFMAASGLNAAERKKNEENNVPDAHLYALMDFSLGLLDTITEFNKQIFNFDFELKIGYNIGDVTAGVIGNTKLLYDIWGDTVNVASRMYSTGEKARIQVTKRIADRLSDVYDFEYRDMIEVKGKGKMETYLLVCKKADAPK